MHLTSPAAHAPPSAPPQIDRVDSLWLPSRYREPKAHCAPQIGIGIGVCFGGGAAPDAFSASPVQTGLVLDLRPLAANITEAGTGVSAFADPERSITFSQGTDANRPSWEATGWTTTSFGTQPSVLFVRANSDRMSGPSTLADVFEGLNTVHTIYVAVQLVAAGAAGQRIFEMENSADADSLISVFPCSAAQKIGYSRRSDAAGLASTSSVENADTNKRIISWLFAGNGASQTDVRRNNTSLTNFPATQNVATITLDRITLGNNFAGTVGLDGRIARILAYSTAHDAATMLSVYTFLAQYL